jgi:RNA polymerase sigma factor (TIGR02999 family)
MRSPEKITDCLRRWTAGEEDALDALIPMVYKELHRRAAYLMRNERQGHTLQPSALVNEAYRKLLQAKNVEWQDRRHFFAIASRAMRQVLVEYARGHSRRPKLVEVPDDSSLPEPFQTSLGTEDLITLDLALDRLAKHDVRKARAVELHFYGGLKNREIAKILDISENTVTNDLKFAQAWLRRELESGKGDDSTLKKS